MGQDPKPDEIPPEHQDFPPDVQKAMLVYNKLGDRMVPEIGYLGKDYTTVELHMRIQKVEDEDIFLETLLRLDEKIIKKCAAQVKAEREKLKNRGK